MPDSVTTALALERGRDSFERHAWGEAHTWLSAADHESSLEAADLERLAVVANLLGLDDESDDLLARAHQEFRNEADLERAARCAFWLGFGLLSRGEHARGGGWLARARRLLDEGHRDSVVHGYLLLPEALQCLSEEDAPAAYTAFTQAAGIGDRFHDADLMSLGRLGQGQTLVRLGRTAEGVTLLDEAMVAVTAAEVSPFVVGLVYCAVIESCQEVFDLRRAREWTQALSRWCESQPDVMLYRGQCLVRRAELMRLRGEWQDALDEAGRACERLSQPPSQAAIGLAFYLMAELHRLRGDFGQAEESYREASQWLRKPRPGMALLRLAQGQVAAAESAIRRLADEAQERRTRAAVLAPYVEIMLAAKDVASARTAADELAGIATEMDAPFLRALSAHASGAVLLAEGQPRAALTTLREAWTTWRDLEAPHEAARARVLLGLTCRALGDDDSGEMELDAARQSFERLGALPDLAAVDVLRRPVTPAAGGLTSREGQVLRLVATGKTNRAIATELRISEKTVARHVSNIFTKLGLSTRAAATAYAYQHNLA